MFHYSTHLTKLCKTGNDICHSLLTCSPAAVEFSTSLSLSTLPHPLISGMILTCCAHLSLIIRAVYSGTGYFHSSPDCLRVMPDSPAILFGRISWFRLGLPLTTSPRLCPGKRNSLLFLITSFACEFPGSRLPAAVWRFPAPVSLRESAVPLAILGVACLATQLRCVSVSVFSCSVGSTIHCLSPSTLRLVSLPACSRLHSCIDNEPCLFPDGAFTPGSAVSVLKTVLIHLPALQLLFHSTAPLITELLRVSSSPVISIQRLSIVGTYLQPVDSHLSSIQPVCTYNKGHYNHFLVIVLHLGPATPRDRSSSTRQI